MKKNLFHAFLVWLPFMAVITFVCLLGYGLVQQDIRMAGNDPQVQIAQDIAHDLSLGASPQDIVSQGQTVDISQTLDPYIIIYSASGTVLGSSAVLNGQTPILPGGVLSDAAAHGEDRVTWQPEPGVRSAIVVDAVPAPGSGFVLAGRSLKETESREDKILHDAMIAWILGLIVMFIILWAFVSLYKKRRGAGAIA